MTSALNQMEAVGEGVLKISLEASMLILTLLLLQWFLKDRLAARLRYSLWMLVWIKLSLPWLPESVTSVYAIWDERPGVVETQSGSAPDIGQGRATLQGELSMNVSDGTPISALIEPTILSDSKLSVVSNPIETN